MRTTILWLVVFLAGMGLSGPPVAAAQADHEGTQVKHLRWQPDVERDKYGSFLGEPGMDPKMFTEGYLNAHPDLRWRREGQYSYNRKQYDIAITQFLRAARYGDKPAQAMLAEMYWKGIGVPRDRPRGYAWMDIAAERRYPNFLILRERYWRGLDANERREAIRIGRPLMDEYGDDQAKVRLARVMRREQHTATGSRLGFVGNVGIGNKPGLFQHDFGKGGPGVGPYAGSGMYVTPEKYYAPEEWQVAQYWQRQAEAWGALPSGRVNVGNPSTLHGQAGRDDKRAPDRGQQDVP